MEPVKAPSVQRFDFLDVLRGVFILVMVEGHTFRALLDPAIKAGFLYGSHELIHNLPGPAFLFAAGITFSFSAQRHWDQRRQWSPRLRGRLLRWLSVLLIGYGLQLTYFSLRRTLEETTPEQLSFLVSLNILQCIVLSLIVLQVLVMAAPSREGFFWTAAAVGLGVALATPFAWNWGSDWPVGLGALVSGRTRSVFPLFPYAGFALAGAAWGLRWISAVEEKGEQPFLRSTLRLCGWLCLGSAAVALLPLPQIYSDFWYTSPLFLFFRVGLLGMLTVGLRLAESRLLPRFRGLVVAGQESLLIYAAHLVLLYGSAYNPDTSLVKLLGKENSAGEVTLVWIVFTGAMVLLGWWWNGWKQKHPGRAKGVKWSLAGYLLFSFVTR